MARGPLTAALLICMFAAGSCCLAQDNEPPAPAGVAGSGVTTPSAFTPLTQPERTRRYLASLINPESILRAAAGAGLSQATNTPSEWGQGAEGYGYRFANSYGQHFIRQTLIYGASSILGEDNRYFASERTGAGPRMMYAIESTFLARRADGTRHLSYSRIGAVVATAFISREWQPHSTNGAQNAAYSMGDVFGSEIGFNIAREFLPKVFRH
ncbi:MAG TPA: hypothetical protein VK789_20015 [Bryobacteraceae bacterium]|jgi:hypothetical protein|nr:hypothetical protein [Bryobacteraceae bacterium]